MAINNIIAQRAYFDTNVFIYLIENNVEYQDTIHRLIEQLESQECEIYTSELTLAECLVRPFQDGDVQSQETYKESIKTSDFLTVKPVSKNILIEASRLRTVAKNKLPDSIHLATALAFECDIFVGNDRKLKTTDDITSVILSDL